MGRIHLFEIEDQTWCPPSMRNAATDLLRFALDLGNHYGCMVPRLRRGLERCGTRQIVDLCSGAGGPWLSLLRVFEEKENFPVEVCLTDWYPNLLAMQRASAASLQRLTYCPDPVDASKMPASMQGFRTLFTSFHHFRPADARAILMDAVNNRQGIGVFEVTRRDPFAILLMVISAPLAFVLTPFIRPFRWSRLFWTYVIPVLPLFGPWDGIVSCLRTYSTSELREMVNSLPRCDYEWEIGEERYWGALSPIPITYLIGYPSDATTGHLASPDQPTPLPD